MEENHPQSALVCEVVEQVAGILWCLRRVPLFEAAILEARRGEVELFSLSYPWVRDDVDPLGPGPYQGCGL